MVFTEGEGRSYGTQLEWERHADVLAAISSLFIFVERSFVKLRPSEAAIQGRYENKHQE